MRCLLLTVLTGCLLSCSSIPPAANPATSIRPTTEIAASLALLHGAHLDENSWNVVKSELKAIGIESWTPKQLTRAKNEVATIDSRAQRVCQQLEEPAIVVGHSQAGAVINQMLKHCPDKVVRAFYLAAVVPLEGEKPFDLLDKADQPAYLKAVAFTKTAVKPKGLNTFLKAMDGKIELKTISKGTKVYSEPLTTSSEVVSTNKDRFEKIPKVYIQTSEDKIISVASQKKYIERTHFEKVLTLPTGHLPMFSNPQAVAQAIREALL